MCATRSSLVAARSSAAVRVTLGSPRRERLAGGASSGSSMGSEDLRRGSFEEVCDLLVGLEGGDGEVVGRGEEIGGQ
jgi:hypothetical protein